MLPILKKNGCKGCCPAYSQYLRVFGQLGVHRNMAVPTALLPEKKITTFNETPPCNGAGIEPGEGDLCPYKSLFLRKTGKHPLYNIFFWSNAFAFFISWK